MCTSNPSRRVLKFSRVPWRGSSVSVNFTSDLAFERESSFDHSTRGRVLEQLLRANPLDPNLNLGPS